MFSLGEPLPHTVRRPNASKNDDEDVEQGLRKGPTEDIAADSDDTLQEARPHKSSGRQQQGDQDEGTETAKKFQIDADTHGGQREKDAVEDGRTDPNSMRNWWARFRAKYPELMAEFLCTASKQLPDSIPNPSKRTRISQSRPVAQRPYRVSGFETGHGHIVAYFSPYL